MHKTLSGAPAYIPYATHMLQRRYTNTSNMIRRLQRKAEAHGVHPSSREIFMHAKMFVFVFLTQTHMETQRLIVYVCNVRLTSLKCVSDIYQTARCNEASFRLGKNFISSDIRTWDHVI